MGLNESASNFINAIKSTREYGELLQSKNIVEKNSSIKNEVNEYNRKLGEIYSSNRSASEIKVKVTELNGQYGGLFKTPEVDRSIKASKAFDEMMFRVYKYINDSIETELKLK